MPVRLTMDNPQVQIWFMLRQVLDSIVKCEEEAFSKVGVTPQQFYVLMALKFIHGPVLSADVAKWLDRNPNSITLIIDRMEKDGLVVRARDLKDRRALRLVTTQKGKEALARTIGPSTELSRTIISCLTQDELEIFTSLTKKIREKTYEYRNIQDKIINMDLEETSSELTVIKGPLTTLNTARWAG